MAINSLSFSRGVSMHGVFSSTTAAATAPRRARSKLGRDRDVTARRSRATQRATTRPFQADTPTSPVNPVAAPGPIATSFSLPGYFDQARHGDVTGRNRPFGQSFARSRHRDGSTSAKRSEPSTRKRQRSKKRPSATVSPIAERPKTHASANSRRASPARLISILRRKRARSNRIVSCGSQTKEPPEFDVESHVVVVSGPSER